MEVASMTTKVEPKATVTVVAPVVAPVVSEASLMASMEQAMKAKDYKAVARVSQELVKYQRTQEQAIADAKSKALVAITTEVKTVLDTAVKGLIDRRAHDGL